MKPTPSGSWRILDKWYSGDFEEKLHSWREKVAADFQRDPIIIIPHIQFFHNLHSSFDIYSPRNFIFKLCPKSNHFPISSPTPRYSFLNWATCFFLLNASLFCVFPLPGQFFMHWPTIQSVMNTISLLRTLGCFPVHSFYCTMILIYLFIDWSHWWEDMLLRNLLCLFQSWISSTRIAEIY